MCRVLAASSRIHEAVASLLPSPVPLPSAPLGNISVNSLSHSHYAALYRLYGRRAHIRTLVHGRAAAEVRISAPLAGMFATAAMPCATLTQPRSVTHCRAPNTPRSAIGVAALRLAHRIPCAQTEVKRLFSQ